MAVAGQRSYVHLVMTSPIRKSTCLRRIKSVAWMEVSKRLIIPRKTVSVCVSTQFFQYVKVVDLLPETLKLCLPYLRNNAQVQLSILFRVQNMPSCSDKGVIQGDPVCLMICHWKVEHVYLHMISSRFFHDFPYETKKSLCTIWTWTSHKWQ